MPSLAFEVDPVPAKVYSKTLVITGSRGADINKILIDGSEVVAQLSQDRWQTNVVLAAGVNTIEIQGRYDDGVTTIDTSVTPVTVTYPQVTAQGDQYWGTLDKYGEVLALKRLPSETNASYKKRLLDVYAHPPGASYTGLVNSISRELGLLPKRSAISIALNQSNGADVLTQAIIHVDQTRIWYTGNELIASEARRVDPDGFWVELTHRPFDPNQIQVVTYNGQNISWTYDRESSAIRFDVSARGKWVRITYQYWGYVTTWNQTLLTVQEELEDTGFFTLSFNDISTSESADGIVDKGIQRIASEVPVTLDWTRIQLTELRDEYLKTILLNSDGTYFDTKLERWANMARRNLRLEWGETILDLDRWQTFLRQQPVDFLPHLWDAKIAEWKASLQSERYNAFEYLGYGGYSSDGVQKLELQGLEESELRSGVGPNDALIVKLAEITT